MVGGQDGGVLLAKLLGAVHTSFITHSLIPLTSFTPSLASVWVLTGGIQFICDVVVVVVKLGGLAFVVVECEQSGDCDITMMSFAYPSASTICLNPSHFSLFPPPLLPFLPLPSLYCCWWPFEPGWWQIHVR